MKAIIQRVKNAKVFVNSKKISEINRGYLLYLGISISDNEEDICWLVEKIVNMRLFNDNLNRLNKSILDLNGDILLVSQFTLQAKTKKGNRPSFINAAKKDFALPIYERFKNFLSKKLDKEISEGIFGANMQVESVNDGPVTIIIDSKNKY